MADLKSEPAYGLVSIQKRNAYSGACCIVLWNAYSEKEHETKQYQV